MGDTRVEWIREKIEHGLGIEGTLFDALAEEQGGAITSYMDGGRVVVACKCCVCGL